MYMNRTSFGMDMRDGTIVWVELTMNNPPTQECEKTYQTDNFNILRH